jgi:hypothetical protein
MREEKKNLSIEKNNWRALMNDVKITDEITDSVHSSF